MTGVGVLQAVLLCRGQYPVDSVMVAAIDLAAFCRHHEVWRSTTEGGPTSARGVGRGVGGSQSGAKANCAGEKAEHCGERRTFCGGGEWKNILKHM